MVNITILRTGWHEAELTITDYPVQFDDTYYFSFNVAEEINTLSINETISNKYLDAAFKGISYFKVINQQSRSLDYYHSFVEYHSLRCMSHILF